MNYFLKTILDILKLKKSPDKAPKAIAIDG